MPPFVLGVEEADRLRRLRQHARARCRSPAELAWSIHDGLTDAGFDLSLSYSLTVDHGVVQSYEMVTGGTDIPLVPLVVNTAAPPLPSLDRCVALGRALGAAIRGGGVPGPGAGRGQRRAVALAALQRPARPVGGRRAARRR